MEPLKTEEDYIQEDIECLCNMSDNRSIRQLAIDKYREMIDYEPSDPLGAFEEAKLIIDNLNEDNRL